MRNTNVLVTHSTVGRIAHHCGPQCQLAELRRGCCRARVAAVGVGIGVARSFASQPAARHCSSFQRVCLHSTSDAVRWMQPLRGTRKAGAVPEKKALSRCARMAGRLDGRWRWPTGRTEWPSSKKVSDSLARSQDRMSQDDECGGTGEASCWTNGNLSHKLHSREPPPLLPLRVNSRMLLSSRRARTTQTHRCSRNDRVLLPVTCIATSEQSTAREKVFQVRGDQI